MKFTVVVDLDDLYTEGDESFTDALKNEILYSVKKEVLEDFRKKVGTEFINTIKANIEVEKGNLILDEIKKQISEKMLPGRYSDSPERTFSEYISQELQNTVFDHDRLKQYLKNLTEDTASSLSAEFKDRYDLLFASQLVAKMNANGLLKENVAHILLNNDKEEK